MDWLLNLLLKALGSAVVFGGVFLAYYWFLIEVVLASSDHGRSKGSVVRKNYGLVKVVQEIPRDPVEIAVKKKAFEAKWRPRMWLGLRVALIVGALVGATNNR